MSDEQFHSLESGLQAVEDRLASSETGVDDLLDVKAPTPAFDARARLRASVYYWNTVCHFFIGFGAMLLSLLQPGGAYWPGAIFGAFFVATGFYGVRITGRAEQQAAEIEAAILTQEEPPT